MAGKKSPAPDTMTSQVGFTPAMCENEARRAGKAVVHHLGADCGDILEMLGIMSALREKE